MVWPCGSRTEGFIETCTRAFIGTFIVEKKRLEHFRYKCFQKSGISIAVVLSGSPPRPISSKNGSFQEPSIVKICILASSSSGNSAFIATDRTRILIDAGLSRREITRRLAAIGEDICKLDAILVTHEHTDHTSGLCATSRAGNTNVTIPIYLTRGTTQYIDWGENPPATEPFQAGSSFTIGDFDIASFTIPHDAADPVGYTLSAQGIKVGIATDLGYIPDSLRIHLRQTDFLLLESNHDLEMLRVGPYPWSVKQRVMSRRGHLSNEVAADFIGNDLDTRISTVVLGHISEHNNHPELVRNLASRALSTRALFAPRLVVAEPGIQTEVFCY
jgi:phosphoribosyl 1,2-cyclic phosphodiesterase